MCDVYDEIIDKLPPSTLRLILEFKNERLNVSNSVNINNLLKDIQNIKINQINSELKRKIRYINSKTEENKKYLSKLEKELETLKSLKNSPGNEQSLKAYTLKINELEDKVRSLTAPKNVDLLQLFKETEDLSNEIEHYQKKISEEKIKYNSYDGFPPDIEQGKEAIAKIKEAIKHNNAVVESFFMS